MASRPGGVRAERGDYLIADPDWLKPCASRANTAGDDPGGRRRTAICSPPISTSMRHPARRRARPGAGVLAGWPGARRLVALLFWRRGRKGDQA